MTVTRFDDVHPRSRRLLEEAGFTWNAVTGVFVNNRRGRAISFETVRDHSPEWLEHWLNDVVGDR